MESNVTVTEGISLKTIKRTNMSVKFSDKTFPEVTRGFSERNVRLFCAKYGIRRLNEYEVDSIVRK